uniref:(northern house mosquito) hypothetical protein n=1 Tax=Culex pipiens TaxID=7175 RepID=A0A8D8GAM6_CULPI
MSKLAISALVIVTAAVAVQGSLFGPFGPFGQPAAPPAFGPPGFVQPGFFPGFPGYQPAVPAYQPSFGPPGYPAGFASVLSPLAARALSPAATVATPATFRPKPSPVLERLQLRVLPEDLQEQLDQLLAAYDQGNAECDKKNMGFGPFVGAYRKCVVFNKIAAEQGATVLENEANVRDAAEAQAAADQANAEKAAAEQVAAEQAAAEQAAADQAATEEAEQAAVVEESAAEETAVVEEGEVVAEEAESTDDAEEPTVEVEETAEVVVEDVADEVDSTVA